MPGGAITAAALFVALFAAVGYALFHDPGASRLLIGLRVLSATLAWCVAVQPAWLTERFEAREGRLAVLVDASRSMSLPRGGEEPSRQARVASLLRRWEDEGRAVSAYTFGQRLEPAELAALAEAPPADRDESRLGAALAALLDEDPELGAVIVVSDGADRAGMNAAVARAGVPVHTVAVVEDELRDDSVAAVSADPVGFLRRTAHVRVTIRSLGGPGGPIPVTLRRGDEVVREVIAEVPPDGEAEVDIPFTPTRLGREVYRVSIPRSPGDAVPENDERAFLVRVARDKLRVLLVSGQPSWDERFLRAFLKRDPATDLISFFILRNTSDMTMAGPDELALIPFPTDELFNEHLGSFDLVIFQNFEYAPYQMAGYLPRIRDYVVRGGSFAMIGGPLSFHAGGYSSTPIAEVLPVELHPRGTPTDSLLHTDRFRPVMAEGMERHPLLSLVPDPVENEAAWGRLAELVGANVVQRVRPDASTLLEHPSARTDEGAPLPLLVLGTAGDGRTMALTTDTTWRWGITTGGETGDASAYERFWDRAVRWLSRDPSLEPRRITTDRSHYGPGARAEVELRLRDLRYQPHAEENVVVSMRNVSSSVVSREAEGRTDREGDAHLEMQVPDEPGAYRVEVRLAGRDASLAEEWLVVEEGGDELADPRGDAALLGALAEATGGRAYGSVDDAPDLVDIDTTRTRSLGVSQRAPFSTTLAFLAFAGVFVTEWVARRRAGRR